MCEECQDNTWGVNCEMCIDGFYQVSHVSSHMAPPRPHLTDPSPRTRTRRSLTRTSAGSATVGRRGRQTTGTVTR